jgi:hypothetical protein
VCLIVVGWTPILVRFSLGLENAASQRLKNDTSPQNGSCRLTLVTVRELFENARDCVVVTLRNTSPWSSRISAPSP